MHVLEIVLERFGSLMSILLEVIFMVCVCGPVKFILDMFGFLMSIMGAPCGLLPRTSVNWGLKPRVDLGRFRGEII